MKNKDVRARIYELAAGKDQTAARIKDEIDTMTAKAEQLEKNAEDALNRGDFEAYKSSRREVGDLKEYTTALAARLINVTVNLTEQEQDAIRDELHAGIFELEERTKAKLSKILPEIERLQAEYDKEYKEYVDAVNTWNEAIGSEHRAYVNSTGTGRLLEQIASLMRPKNI